MLIIAKQYIQPENKIEKSHKPKITNGMINIPQLRTRELIINSLNDKLEIQLLLSL